MGYVVKMSISFHIILNVLNLGRRISILSFFLSELNDLTNKHIKRVTVRVCKFIWCS